MQKCLSLLRPIVFVFLSEEQRPEHTAKQRIVWCRVWLWDSWHFEKFSNELAFKLSHWSEWICSGNPYTQKTWSHNMLATCLAVWLVYGKALPALVKWSVTTSTSTECCLLSPVFFFKCTSDNTGHSLSHQNLMIKDPIPDLGSYCQNQ